MIISIPTQKEMYSYILSNKTTGLEIADNKLDDIISMQIKELARKLYSRSDLYIGKIRISKDKKHKLKKDKNYKCKSNQLIYYVLDQFPESASYATDKMKTQLTLECPEDFWDVSECGTKGRKKLLKLCKLYLDNRDIRFSAKHKTTEEYDLAKESFLAEAAFGKYSEEVFGEKAKVFIQKVLKKSTPTTHGLRSDIIMQFKNMTILIDVKVYSKVGEKYYQKYVYSSNANRYQVNSYIGAFVEEHILRRRVVGVVLHIVDADLWEKNQELQGTDLTIEPDRPIHLYMIQDNGLNYIFSEYNKLINEIVKS